MLLTDKFDRAITDLRISITDRCNYKCVYCRTGNEGALYGELPFDDYLRMARDAGLWPVKVNCVLMRGFNEDQIIPFGIFAREEGVVVRFIEFMPLEEDRVWAPSTVVPLDEILERMGEYRSLIEIPHAKSETARRYRFDDGIGEIGIIAPVSHPFCGHCSRIRITSDGKIRTCLFSVWDHDLHELMRRGASDEELVDFIRGVVQRKEERHHIGEPDFVPASRTMVHIGG